MQISYAMATGSAPVQQDLAAELEMHSIQSALGETEWTLHGRRNRIFVLAAGAGIVRFEGELAALTAPCLVWVPAGKPAILTLKAGSRGATMAISAAALAGVPLPGNIAEDLGRLAVRPQLGTPLKSDAARRICELLGAMESELRDRDAGSYEVIRHLLALICTMLWRVSDLVPLEPKPVPRAIVSSFLQLVDLHMRHHWNVADYARYLGVSTDRLNSAVQRATGRSPLDVVHTRLITEACQMLESSGLQISGVASLLGFDDAAYFSRFFKRMTGKSPRQYREASAHRQAPTASSFAAWP